jgi:hypothetical protein
MDFIKTKSTGQGLIALTILALALSLACGGSSSKFVPAPATPANPSGWTGPQVLEGSLTMESGVPSVAMDGTGNAFAAWQKGPPPAQTTAASTNAIWGNAYLTGSSWQADKALGAPSGSSQDVVVAGDGSGNYLYAWDFTTDNTNYAVYVNTYSVAAGAGATPFQLSSGSSFTPALAMNAHGAACVVWMTQTSSFLQVWATQYSPSTQKWSTPQQVSTTTLADAIYPTVGMDSAGNVVLMWIEGVYANAGPYVPQVASFVPGTGWSAPYSPMTAGDFIDTSVSLAVSDGGAMAAWAESSDGGRTFVIRTARWTATAGAWSSTVTASASGGGAILPAVALDASGNALLAWATGATAAYAPTGIATASCTAAGAWQAPQNLVAGSLGVESLMLAMNASGAGVLAFNQYDGANWRVAAANVAPSSGWAPSVYIQTSTGGGAGVPSVSINASGQAMVVWNQVGTGNLTHIYGNHFN